MNESELQSSGSIPRWAEDISRARASASYASSDRRLVVFLAALSAEIQTPARNRVAARFAKSISAVPRKRQKRHQYG